MGITHGIHGAEFNIDATYLPTEMIAPFRIHWTRVCRPIYLDMVVLFLLVSHLVLHFRTVL